MGAGFRVRGHGLLNSGQRVYNHQGQRVRRTDDPMHRAMCGCGKLSDSGMTMRELYAWHRAHKIKIAGAPVPGTITSERGIRIGLQLEVPGPGVVTWTGDRMVFTPEEEL